VMIVAGLVTVLFHRFKQPVVLGYILAGVIIGPHTPPFPLIHDEETIKTLAELGVIFLMFSLGLEFSLRKLKQVGATAFTAALLEILLMLWLGYEIGLLFGWKVMDSIFLGAILSISSTTIIIKALGELGKAKERFAELIFGILIVEDILAIVLIAVLSGLATTGTLRTGDVAMTLGKLVVFLVVLLVVGLLTVPRLLEYLSRFKSNEMMLVAVLGLCFGVCLLAAKMGYSVALGAFIIGAVIAESREIGRVERLTEPIRDMFSAVFFVAIGLLIDPQVLTQYWLPITVITIAVVVGKVLACSFGTFVAGNDLRSSLRVGMGLAQIGEFSFIIASLGLTLRVTSHFLYPIAVMVSVLTTLLTPYLIKSADGMVNWFDRKAPRPVLQYLDTYTQWLSRLTQRKSNSMGSALVRKWIWQMTLNLVLTAAVFIGAAFIAGEKPAWLSRIPGGETGRNAMLWLGSVLLSFPLLIATFRKLQAMGMLLSEMRVSEAAAGERAANIRAIIAQAITTAGSVLLGLFVLVLSTAILPPLNVLVVLLVIAGLTGWLGWRAMVRVYAKAQISLSETLSRPPASKHEEQPTPVHNLLKQAELKEVIVGENSQVAGKVIRETEMRSKTGASIVAIGRGGENIINPGPEEEIRGGDTLILLGRKESLDAADAFVAGIQ
jgi:CPA2 family monovalent cation:H+ antiporter-2